MNAVAPLRRGTTGARSGTEHRDGSGHEHPVALVAEIGVLVLAGLGSTWLLRKHRGRRSRTREETNVTEEQALGPISYMIAEFPGNKMTGEGFPILVDLVNQGVIRVLDLRFMTKDLDGSVRAMELSDIDHDGQFDMAVFEGASAGLIDESDFADAAAVIEPGSSAGILIFENRWATPFINALRSRPSGAGGGRLHSHRLGNSVTRCD